MNDFLKQHESTVLVGGGLALMGIGTAYLVHKAPVVNDIRKAANAQQPAQNRWTTTKQIAKEVWPGALAWAVGAGAIACADVVSTQKLVAATATAEVAKDIYKLRVEAEKKCLEEKPEGRDILSAIQKEVGEKIATDPRTKPLAINAKPGYAVTQTGNGDQLFILRPTQMKFRSSMDAIQEAKSRMKDDIRNNGWASYNDLLREFNLPTSTLFERLGWNHEYPFDLSLEPYIDGMNVVVDITFPYGCEPVENYAHW